MGRESSGKTLTPSGYRKLVREVSALIEQGRAEAESAVGHVLAVTYWKVGQRLLSEQLSEHAGYGSGMVEELASELQMDPATLRRALVFARAYPRPPGPGLSWVHYRELIGVKDAREREWYARRALSAGWSGRKLSAEIRADGYALRDEAPALKGRARLPRPDEATHVYRAWVERVIDGDTLLLHVDLGFEVIKEQRLRLAAVDAAPLVTTEGRAAWRFVLERLGGCEFVVVKTNRVDQHGRYVGHVFYGARREMGAAEVFRKGRYLNDEMVRAGVAGVA